MLVYLFLLPLGIASLELPLAPFNVKVFCRQGRRYSRPAQTAVQCPSSSTACGYFEFSLPNKAGIDQTGIYDCVDSGILKNLGESEEIDWDAEEDLPEEDVLFPQLCGSQPSCSSLSIDQLNPAFSRYLVTQYGIQLEKLRDGQIRFCCSLFHATLQKLVTSGADRLPSASASSMHCGGEICEAGAVGCLVHSVSSGDDDDYDDKKKKRRTRRQNADDFDIAPVEFSFDTFDYEEESLAIVTRAPSLPTNNKTTQFLPSLNLPIVAPSPASTVKSVTKNGVKYAVIDEDDEEGDEEEELHCVYRHLNDELYRWCLLVHQTKTGDRCYYHQGHTVCCCFAPPDTDTCDPTEMELVVPGKTERPAIIRVTPRPTTAFPIPPTTSATTTTSTSTSTSTTTSTTTTTTSTTTTTTTPAPTPPPTTPVPRCRVTYTKTKGRRTPLLVCSSSLPTLFFSLVVIIFVTNR